MSGVVTRRLLVGAFILVAHFSSPAADRLANSTLASSGTPSGTSRSNTHWSLQPLHTPPIPPFGERSVAVRNGIDAFVLEGLDRAGLRPSPEADRRTLIRRLTCDLLGLPPSPSDIEAFVNDASPRAYAALVDRLLNSPRYGERWARHWLDVVRYTESQGYEYDKLRDHAWHYRDYVIDSFNGDKPYDRFMQEQIAGDVLPPIRSHGIIATSLLVCGSWDEAGNSQFNATQKAITREEEMEDLVSVVGQTFLGLTINCARCHDHKFDPISQAEYYQVKSVFDGVKHGERPFAAPEEVRAREDEIVRWTKVQERAREQAGLLEQEGRRVALAKQAGAPTAPGETLTPWLSWNFDGQSATQRTGELKGRSIITNDHLSLSREGDFYQTPPLSRDVRAKTLTAWVTLADLNQRGGGVISLQREDGAAFDAIVFGERESGKWMAGSTGFERSADLDAPRETIRGAPIHMAAVYAEDNSIALYRNGKPYGSRYTPKSPLETFRARRAAIVLGMRHKGGSQPWLRGDIHRASLYDRALTAEEVATLFVAESPALSPEEWLAHLGPEPREQHRHHLAEAATAQRKLEALRPLPVSYVGTRVQPAPTRRLSRGDVTSPQEVVSPGALAAIAGVAPDFGLSPDAPEAERRLRFAEWLGDRRNPLPARVMANRIWHFHFGQGLVSTPNDFGASGARPSHPQLLDWLAVQFQQSGWSIKALHRLIVLSATYRQSSAPREDGMKIDADNQWLWRYTPRRLEAEALRDAMLAISGQINYEMGGPSFRSFDILKFPASAYVPSDKIGAAYNRRTIYRMNVNSGKEPLLDAFDCPDPSVKTPRRGITTTPLQALGLMNNPFVQRQASHLSTRARQESRPGLPNTVERVYQLVLGRSPTAEEQKRAVSAAQERGLDHVCWALLNSTEFIYVR